jgi:hypothetical protein
MVMFFIGPHIQKQEMRAIQELGGLLHQDAVSPGDQKFDVHFTQNVSKGHGFHAVISGDHGWASSLFSWVIEKNQMVAVLTSLVTKQFLKSI